jgi:hypothetical protein
MRVAVSDSVRAQPGDEIYIRAALAPDAKLGRLFVFAKLHPDEVFSPYVAQLGAKLALADSKPPFLTPLVLRLTEAQPMRLIKFPADIDGWYCVMEEIDLLKDPRSRVRLWRRIDPKLPRIHRIKRWFSELWA